MQATCECIHQTRNSSASRVQDAAQVESEEMRGRSASTVERNGCSDGWQRRSVIQSLVSIEETVQRTLLGIELLGQSLRFKLAD